MDKIDTIVPRSKELNEKPTVQYLKDLIDKRWSGEIKIGLYYGKVTFIKKWEDIKVKDK